MRYYWHFVFYLLYPRTGGICCGGILTLQKIRFGGPGKPSFWSVLDYVFFRFFYGSWWVFIGFRRFFYGLWRSCFIKNLVLLTETCFFFAETSSKPGFDTPTRFFQGFGWCRIQVCIYIYTHIFNIYIDFRCFGGICCGGILTLQKIKVWRPRHNR